MSSYPYLVFSLSFSLNILWLVVIRHCIVHRIDQEIIFLQFCLLKTNVFLKPTRTYCSHFSMLQMCNDCKYFVTGYCRQRSRWRRQWLLYLIYLTPMNFLFWPRVKCHLPCMRIRIWPILRLCTVISSRAQLDIVALCLVCQTFEPEDQGRFQGGHLKQNVFYLRRFSESRSSSGSTPSVRSSVRPSVCPSVCPFVRPSVRNT